MKFKKVLSLICVLAIASVMFTGCSNDKNTIKKNSFDTEAVSSIIGDVFVTENDNFKLEINEVTKGIILTDKNTGKVYGTNPIEEGGIKYDELGMPIKRHPQLESVLFIKYLDTQKNTTSDMISYTAAVSKGRTTVEMVEDGVKVNYYFDDAQIMVPVTFTLREKGVALTINPAEIQENENMLITASLAPMFCSVKNTDDGYLFYPSGSGALVYAKEISQPGESYSSEVYGFDAAKDVWDQTSTNKDIRLPVIGAKFGEQAVVGIIENAAEACLVDMKVGATSLGYSSVYVTYQLRGFTANIKELYNNRFYKGDVFAEDFTSSPLTVCYYPLADDEANYSGMAKVYREYLNETAGKAEGVKPSVMDITMVGGAMIDKSFLGVPYQTIYETTTISDVEQIIKELTEKGIKVTNLNLSGFTQNGIDSNKLGGGFKLDSKLGNSKQLAALQNDIKASGTNLFFDFNIISFNKNANGYNTYFDAAVRANRRVAKLYSFDIAVWGRDESNTYSLLARDRLNDAANAAFKAVNKWKVTGVGFQSLSSTAYSDYSSKKNFEFYSKGNISKQVSDIYLNAKKQNLMMLSSDANAYAAAVSNVVLNIPTSSTKAYVFDEDVPFYAMAMRGRTAISSESLNLAIDGNLQLLRAVESGAGIAYTLTNNYSTQLLNCETTVFYNSCYDDLSTEIEANYKKVYTYYEKIGNSEIVSHSILANGLRETVFANGVKVYVNYLNEAIESDLGTVDANSFLVGEATA